ncbi:activator of HSP90 ATPase [Luteimicrobium album]|uniref:Activator of HSP90 ATPase n=1 Tax=Luteimicrobium album TaxID=1054550 RepID=A0ABQ6I052_9MICO|nr:SRPBCC domain-containing protein [Luteimicrobium album]GMA24081.1 activator of HSP90 ATPase [Luteimicrobium album]
MVDILQRVGVVAPRETVHAALTTIEGLAGWWTQDTKGDAAVGGEIRFDFEPGSITVRVLESRPDLVRWEVVDGPAEWIGTHIVFELAQESEYTIVRFRHEGWAEPVEFMAHCTTKWATFLMSLKRLGETGVGEPAPGDVQISDWH